MMDVRIRPAGYIIFAVVLLGLGYRLLYTLLWAPSSTTNGSGTSAVPAKASAIVPPTPAPSSTPVVLPKTAKPLTDWLVLAPIPCAVTGPAKADNDMIGRILDKTYLPDEAQLAPSAGDKVTVNGKNFTWVKATGSPLDLVATAKKTLGTTTTTNMVGYAVTTVDSPKTTSDATLYVGSDDGVMVWVNGKMVHRNGVARGLRVGEDKISGLSLNAGKNTLVFKIGQGEGDWSLAALIDIP